MRTEVVKLSEEIDNFAKRAGSTNEQTLISIYENKIRELAKKKEELERKLRNNFYTDKDFGTATEKIFVTLTNPMSMWKSDSYKDKRSIISMYFGEGLRYDFYRGFGTATLAYPIKLINKFGQAKSNSVEMSGYEPESG